MIDIARYRGDEFSRFSLRDHDATTSVHEKYVNLRFFARVWDASDSGGLRRRWRRQRRPRARLLRTGDLRVLPMMIVVMMVMVMTIHHCGQVSSLVVLLHLAQSVRARLGVTHLDVRVFLGRAVVFHADRRGSTSLRYRLQM